ncbi:MAG: NAD(P)H-dependent oxidoreductase [Roseburia sp.]|nr:NAD(P)H-dependent oxidoreductase [Roseburia sp.]
MKNVTTKVFRLVCVLLMFAVTAVMFDVNAGEAKTKKKEDTVILYFSATGTTKGAAQRIKKAVKGKMTEIKAAQPYTEEDLDYGEDDTRVTKEHESAESPAKSSVRPEIANLNAIKKAVKKAKVVYIGYPIWWGEAPHIVYTLVENVNLKGKTVIPFCTSVSSGLGNSAKNLKTKALISSKTKWLKGRNFFDVPSQKTVDQWVKNLK